MKLGLGNKVLLPEYHSLLHKFLINASRILKQKTEKSYKQIFERNIFGVDIQTYSVKRTEILLSLLAITEGEDEEKFNFNLYPGNSLEFNWQEHNAQIKKNKGFDLILGNPPYVYLRNMDARTKELIKKWSVCSTGHPDLYIPFFQIGYELLNKSLNIHPKNIPFKNLLIRFFCFLFQYATGIY
jgi:hypothetical protein